MQLSTETTLAEEVTVSMVRTKREGCLFPRWKVELDVKFADGVFHRYGYFMFRSGAERWLGEEFLCRSSHGRWSDAVSKNCNWRLEVTNPEITWQKLANVVWPSS